MKRPLLGAAAVLLAVVLTVLWQKGRKDESGMAFIPEAPPVVLPPDPLAQPPAPTKIESVLYGAGKSPGGCPSMAACEEYCSHAEAAAECLEWLSRDQREVMAETVRRDSAGVIPDIRAQARPQAPGNCEGKACGSYCRRPENEAQCQDFCSNPKNHASCRGWGGLTPAVEAVLSGELVR